MEPQTMRSIEELRRLAAIGTTRPLPLKKDVKAAKRARAEQRRLARIPRGAVTKTVDYGKRNKMLAHIGFQSYAEYLASPLWAKIRRRVFARGWECYVCEEPSTCIHHDSYDMDTLLGKSLAWLFPLCAECHHQIEFDDVTHRKLLPEETRRRLRELRASRTGEDPEFEERQTSTGKEYVFYYPRSY
jgi:hypothetical protein